MLKKYLNRESISYLVFGVLTTAVDYFVYQVLRLLDVHYLFAQGMAWTAAVLFAFVTNKIFVFQSREMRMRTLFLEFVSFVSARIASLLFTLGGLWLFVDRWKVNEWITKLILSAFVIVMNYFFSKRFVFRQKQ